jgi:hypothetical protein
MAEQNANAIAITGGTISGVTLPASNITGTLDVGHGGTGATTLTGYVKGTGTAALTASSTIPNTDITGLGTASTKDAGAALGVATLDSSGKVPISELPAAVLGALSYQGTWDASTNTPTLTSSVGTKGYYYVVSVAGNTNLNGVTDWLVGDWAVFNGTAWQKIDNTDSVTSVNGLTGAVVLTTTNIAEGTNEYFTTAKARASVSAGTGISYNSTTGVITNSSPSLGGDVVGPASATDNAVARFDATTGKLIQNSVTLIDDTGNASGILSQQFSNGSAVALAAGKLWYDGAAGSWNAGMGGGNITQQIGEELFVYGKASAAITDSPLQIIYQTGAVGASGVITFAPTIAGITDGFLILGVATESLALNDFGRITSYGVVRGITTNGTAFGETWADGDEIYYNPVTGNPTNIKPVAPNVKVSVGTLIKAGNGNSGSIQVEINHGSVLGGTDSNVELTSVTNGNILTYDGGNGYWKNTDLTAGTAISVAKSANGVLTVNNTGVTSAVAGTGISVSGATGAVTVTNTAPDQTVALTAGTGISTSGTYPNFTITNTAPSSGGTVTSVAALTLGTTGTDLSSTVANSTTTPVITLQVPTASATNRGALSAADWTTFNGKQAALVSGTNIKTVSGTSLLGSGDLGTIGSTYGGTGQSTYAVGDLLQGGATNTLTKLAAVATGNALISGGVTTASSWGKIGLTTHISGTLAVGNGGTGLTSLTANYIPYGNGTGAFSSTSAFTYTSTGLGVGTSATSIIDGRVDQATTTYLTVQNRYHAPSTTQKAGLKLQLGDISESFKWCSIEAIPTSAYESSAGLSFNTYNGTTPYEVMRMFPTGGVSIGNTTDPNTANLSVTGTGKFGTTVGVGAATPSTSGAGITFPATQSASTNANTLDDYEEGTWTPNVGGTATYSLQRGTYTKIGNLVTIRCVLQILLLGTGSGTTISGLPFTSGTITDTVASGALAYFANLPSNVVYIAASVPSNTSTVTFSTLAAAGATLTPAATVFASTTRVDFSLTYFAA